MSFTQKKKVKPFQWLFFFVHAVKLIREKLISFSHVVHLGVFCGLHSADYFVTLLIFLF